MQMNLKTRHRHIQNAIIQRGAGFAALAVFAAGLTVSAVSPTQAQTIWTFDITNGNGSGLNGNRVFDLNALLNSGQPFTQGSIASGLTTNVNAAATNDVPISPPIVLFYTGTNGPVYFTGSDPTPFFHIVDADKNNTADFLDNNALNGLASNGVDNFTLGTFDATGWLNTLNPAGNAPVTFTGSFHYTLFADLENVATGAVFDTLPARTPGGTTDPSVLFTVTIKAAPSAVPEPGSVVLLTALCMTGAGFLRRRHSR